MCLVLKHRLASFSASESKLSPRASSTSMIVHRRRTIGCYLIIWVKFYLSSLVGVHFSLSSLSTIRGTCRRHFFCSCLRGMIRHELHKGSRLRRELATAASFATGLESAASATAAATFAACFAAGFATAKSSPRAPQR
jgi:hypothetical protein